MSSVRKNFTGKIFGNLTALKFERSEVWVAPSGLTKRFSQWRFACVCGNETVARISSVTSGNTTSCGCFRKERTSIRSKVDVTGKRSGKLAAIAAIGGNGRGVIWLCRCDCGKEVNLEAGRILSGRNKSCGCAQWRPPIYTSKGVAAREMKVRRRERRIRNGGSFTEKQVADLFKLQRGRCAGCIAKLGDKFHRDHKMPLALGGSNDISNIQLLCQRCNQKKASHHPIDWAQKRGMLL